MYGGNGQFVAITYIVEDVDIMIKVNSLIHLPMPPVSDRRARRMSLCSAADISSDWGSYVIIYSVFC